MFSSRYISPPRPLWLPDSQVHLFPHNPYPQPQSYSPPQPIAHKVWIIDCKSCATFLTNRGMKAVLLLHPNVALYSSDALPVNCSAYSNNPDALRPATSCRTPARTCECLTQTLCCHGCGAAIGYMIVIPCVRCTSSITATNRATNGHRFVFHSSEVTGTERYYIPDEPGVMPVQCIPAAPSADFPYEQSIPYEDDPRIHTSGSDYLPTPPVDANDLSPASSPLSSPTASSFPLSFSGPSHNRAYLPSPPPLVPASPRRASDESIRHFMYRYSPNILSMSPDAPPPPIASGGMPSEPREWTIELKAGDALYWHHLVRHGEIPGVANDPRARTKASSRPTAPTTTPPPVNLKFMLSR